MQQAIPPWGVFFLYRNIRDPVQQRTGPSKVQGETNTPNSTRQQTSRGQSEIHPSRIKLAFVETASEPGDTATKHKWRRPRHSSLLPSPQRLTQCMSSRLPRLQEGGRRVCCVLSLVCAVSNTRSSTYPLVRPCSASNNDLGQA